MKGRPRATILVVDDEEIVRELCESMLARLGFATVGAGNGREALERFEGLGGEVAAVVLDLAMPVMGGEEALRSLRARRPDLPVVVTSGYYSAEATARLVAEPAVELLKKPYALAELEAALERLLGP
ncbi:MAG: response regulator [Planctomycetes bacterium]|nr:response regulator [Planctomycetota bacterium]